MKTNLKLIKSIKGKLFGGIYGKIIHIHNNDDELILYCSKPLISIHSSQGNGDDRFWSFDWEELKTGEDVLLINDRKTPDPLDYKIIESPTQKYIISASSYYTRKNLITEVWGYGFFESNVGNITSIVLKLEDSFIHIGASPAIEIRITKDKPTIEESLSLLVSS